MSKTMANPFKRLFDGILIGVLLSIPFLLGQDQSFGSTFMAKIQAMPLVDFDAFLAVSVAFLGFACAWVGAMMTGKAQPSFASRPTVEPLRRRRQRQREYHLLR